MAIWWWLSADDNWITWFHDLACFQWSAFSLRALEGLPSQGRTTKN